MQYTQHSPQDCWLNNPVAAFDLETTGLDTETDRIVTATFAVLAPTGEIMFNRENRPMIKQWLVNPGVDIPVEASRIHGVTTGQAQQEGTPAPVAVNEIRNMINWGLSSGIPVAGYNVRYDFSLLTHEIARYGIEPIANLFPILDAFPLYVKEHKYERGKKLVNAAEKYGVRLDNAHSSTDDAIAAVHVLQAMGRAHPVYGSCNAGDLHNATVRLYEEQDDSYQGWLVNRYRNGQGSFYVINRGFPTYVPKNSLPSEEEVLASY